MIDVVAKRQPSRAGSSSSVLSEFVPDELRELDDPQTAIPRIVRTPALTRLVDAAVQQIPTKHVLNLGDARKMTGL